MVMRLCVAFVFSFVVGFGSFAQAQVPAPGNNPLITVDEDGVGSLLFTGGVPSIPAPGVLAPDPGPGGLPLALTYNLLGPPSLVAGDVLVYEDQIGGTLSDIIRFNPANTGSVGYPASLVFYSDNFDGLDNLADVGFPLGLYTNVLSLLESDIGGGMVGLLYTPSANQPGFVAGFSVTYRAISDAERAPVPEPVTTSLIGIGLAVLATSRRRRAA